mmetsp:Transcript_31966/g.74879  ORF Transcript_31966/g.74879 Transcript_31966/m.74879 type:complete len:699 (-) Transcript_31966:22-2118(-)
MWVCRAVRQPCCGRRRGEDEEDTDLPGVSLEDSNSIIKAASATNSEKPNEKAKDVEADASEDNLLKRLPEKPCFPALQNEKEVDSLAQAMLEIQANSPMGKVESKRSNSSETMSETPESEFSITTRGGESLADRIKERMSRRQPKQKPSYHQVLTGEDSSLTSASLKIDINNPGNLTDFYDIGRKLGEGSFGSVVEGAVKSTGAIRAVKSINKVRFAKKFKLLRREISIGKMVDHPNIIKLYELFEDEQHLHLVMEICPGGELSDRIPSKGMGEEDAATCLVQILRGINYMHKHRICHRDLKAQNILITGHPPSKRRESIFSNPGGSSPRSVSSRTGPPTNSRKRAGAVTDTLENRLRISDFGVSCGFKPGTVMTERAGTPTHMAPEVFQKKYTQVCDIWSCGVILYQLLSNRLPFEGDTEDVVKTKILRYQYLFGGEFLNSTNEVIELLQGMLREPATRISAEGCLRHAWFLKSLPVSEPKELRDEVIANLRGYQGLNRFKKASLNVVASLLTEEQIYPARQAFMDIDADGDGYVSTAELREKMLAMKVKKHHVDAAVNDIFRDKDSQAREREVSAELNRELSMLRRRTSFREDLRLNSFAYTEFLAATFDRDKFLTEEVCMAAFQCFDKDGSGKLSADELVSGKLLGKLEEDEIDALMKDFDADGDGEIDRYEFMNVMTSGENWARCFRSKTRHIE